MGTAAALSVKITANTGEFTKGMKQVEDTAGAAGGKIQTGFGGAVNTALGTLSKLSVVIGGLGIGKVVTDMIQAGGRLADLSAQTAISVRELQRLQYTGELVGVSLDQIATGASMLQKRLGGGESSAVEAVRQLGLNMSDLVRMEPGAMFETIASSIGQIPDPLQRAAIAADLFGRAGTQFLPLFRSDMQKLGDEAEAIGAVFGEDLVNGADELGDAWTRLSFIGQGLLARALRPLLEHASKLPTEIARFRAMMSGDLAGVLTGGSTEMPTVARPASLAGGGVPTLTMSDAEARGLERELDAQIRKQQAAAEAWQKELDRLSGREAIAAANEWMRKVAQIGGATKLAAADQRQFNDALEDALDAMQRLGRAVDPAMLAQWAKLQQASFVGPGITTTMGPDTIREAEKIALLQAQVQSTIGTLGQIGSQGPELILQPLEMADLSSQSLAKNFDHILKTIREMPTFMQKAFGGATGMGTLVGDALVAGLLSAGNRMQAFLTTLARNFGDSLSQFLSSSLKGAMESAGGFFSKGIGKFLGGALSSVLPVIGDLISGLLGKLFGPTEYEKRVRSEAEERKQIAATTDMATLQQQAAFTGRGDLLAQFLAVKDTAQPEYLRGLVAELEERTNRLNAAMERYGISWEMLGEKAKQSQIDQMAIQFIQDFEVLSQAGMDVNLIIEKMSGKVNEFVQAAIRTGTEVPIAMQPMLQKMLEMGLLTDEAGNQLTDLTSIQFSQTMTQGFQAVVEAINHLTKALGYDIPNAANLAANGMNEAFARVKGPEIPGMSREDWETWGRGGGSPPDAFTPHGDFPAMAAGGIVRRPTVALIGEAGPEAVVPLRGTGGMGTTVILEVDGRTMAQVVVPHIPGEVQRYGLA